ncbi:MAG: hypothetical protein ACTSQH_00660 [Candidatus Hodarchaeales archaeon]
MNNTEYRTSTSVFSQMNRMVREIENHRAISSDFYEELRKHASILADGSSDDGLNNKQRFKRIAVIIEELKERYWDLTDLLTELSGIEILESPLTNEANLLSSNMIDILKQMEPTVRNAHKSLRSNELGVVVTDLLTIVENPKFEELNDVLIRLGKEIDKISGKLEDLRQKRIM